MKMNKIVDLKIKNEEKLSCKIIKIKIKMKEIY